MGEEQIRELGLSFSFSLFGGLHSANSRIPIPRPGEPCGQIFTFIDTDLHTAYWLDSYDQSPRDGWERIPLDGSPARQWLVPAFFCSCVFSQGYWDDVVNRRGTEALKHPRLAYVFRPETWAKNIPLIEPRADEFRPMLKRIQDDMATRTREVEDLCNSRYPERVPMRSKWTNTLWSNVGLRKQIARFRNHHCRQDLEECRRAARTIFTSSRKRLGDGKTNQTHILLYVAIAYL